VPDAPEVLDGPPPEPANGDQYRVDPEREDPQPSSDVRGVAADGNENDSTDSETHHPADRNRLDLVQVELLGRGDERYQREGRQCEADHEGERFPRWTTVGNHFAREHDQLPASENSHGDTEHRDCFDVEIARVDIKEVERDGEREDERDAVAPDPLDPPERDDEQKTAQRDPDHGVDEVVDAERDAAETDEGDDGSRGHEPSPGRTPRQDGRQPEVRNRRSRRVTARKPEAGSETSQLVEWADEPGEQLGVEESLLRARQRKEELEPPVETDATGQHPAHEEDFVLLLDLGPVENRQHEEQEPAVTELGYQRDDDCHPLGNHLLNRSECTDSPGHLFSFMLAVP
jgi:hypothetical protein